jgi:hypothetical protein
VIERYDIIRGLASVTNKRDFLEKRMRAGFATSNCFGGILAMGLD